MSVKNFIATFLFHPPIKLNLKSLRAEFENKKVLITGASYGIGASLAYILGRVGAELILLARSEKKLLAMKKYFDKKSVKCQILTIDLYDEKAVNDLINKIDFKIDFFVNNAGKSIKRSIYDSLSRMKDFERTIKLNYLVPVKFTLLFLKNIGESKGVIVNVSSLSLQFFAPAKWSAYQSSKMAYYVWCKSVEPELKKKNISCVNIFLPLVKTRMIIPTKKYRKIPAISSKQSALIIASAIIRKKDYKPWWTPLPKFLSFFFEKTLSKIFTKY